MIAENVTSNLFLTIQKLLFLFGRTVFDKTSVVFLSLFMTFYGCKFVWDISYKILFKHKLEVEDIIKPLLIISCVTVIMSGSSYIEDWLVRPVYDLAVGLTTLTAALVERMPEGAGIVDMLNLIDTRLNHVIFVPCKKIVENVGFLEWFIKWGMGIIILIYLIVWLLFLAIMVNSIFRFVTFYAISPLIVVSLFFPQSKPIAIAGFKSLLHGVLGMFMAGVAMGFTIAIIGESPELFYNERHEIKSNWIFGPEYFTLVLLGLLSISFHLKAVKVSANLSNIDDGAGPEAAVAALGSMAVMSGKAAMGRMGGMLGGKSVRGAGKGATRLGKYGIDRFKNGKSAASLYQHMTGK